MNNTGFKDQPLAKGRVPISDLMTALYMALGIVSALYEKKGQYLDVFLFESAVTLVMWETGGYFDASMVSQPNGSVRQAQAPYQAVLAKDDHVTIGVNARSTWKWKRF